MLQIMQEVAMYAGSLLLRVIPILIFAVFVAEVARIYLGEEKLAFLLAGRSPWGARLRAAALGAVLPFCECGAFPVGIALIKAGVPLSAVLTFFLVSPVLSIPAFLLLGGLLGVPLAVVYALTTLLGGITAAFLIGKVGLADVSALKIGIGTKSLSNNGQSRTELTMSSCCEGSNDDRFNDSYLSVFHQGWQQTFLTFKQILPYLLAAVVVAGLVVELIPPQTMEDFLVWGGAWGVPLAALLGIPLYQGDCAMISILAPLIKATGAVGSGVALIVAGTGTSINGLVMLNALFHRKFIAAYLLSILLIAVLAGYMLQLVS